MTKEQIEKVINKLALINKKQKRFIVHGSLDNFCIKEIIKTLLKIKHITGPISNVYIDINNIELLYDKNITDVIYNRDIIKEIRIVNKTILVLPGELRECMYHKKPKK